MQKATAYMLERWIDEFGVFDLAAVWANILAGRNQVSRDGHDSRDECVILTLSF